MVTVAEITQAWDLCRRKLGSHVPVDSGLDRIGDQEMGLTSGATSLGLNGSVSPPSPSGGSQYPGCGDRWCA